MLEQDRQRDEKMVRRGQVELLREYTKERKYEVTCRRLNRVSEGYGCANRAEVEAVLRVRELGRHGV